VGDLVGHRLQNRSVQGTVRTFNSLWRWHDLPRWHRPISPGYRAVIHGACYRCFRPHA
jgi:hypothetical protein